ncbi:hypothetical protein [Phycicoccus sp. SLBN-51]|nr:hypothetical protein [Phycicoccus sp. SLBN-51]TQJ48652.1 hypothetical protein FBY26_0315 [Phycicoccus sp. SLBN-51]
MGTAGGTLLGTPLGTLLGTPLGTLVGTARFGVGQPRGIPLGV